MRNANGGKLPETAEEKKHRETAAAQGSADMFYVILAVAGAVIFMALVMVSTDNLYVMPAFFAGQRLVMLRNC